LQDADRLDMLRYDIEKDNWQRFNPEKLNNPENAKLISAVIELNTRQALETGYLQKEDLYKDKDFNKIGKNFLQLYFDNQITYYDTDNARSMMHSKQKNRSSQMNRNIEEE